MAAAKITEKLGLHGLRHRQWFSQSACANADDGFLRESGLDLSHALVVAMRQSRQSVFPVEVPVQSPWMVLVLKFNGHVQRALSEEAC